MDGDGGDNGGRGGDVGDRESHLYASSAASIAVGINTHESALEAVAMRKLRPPMPIDLPLPINELITSCWHSNPRMRPSFQDVVTRLERIVSAIPIDKFPFQIADELKAMPRVDLSPWQGTDT